ncbi:MAG: hypothetical protein ACKOUT_10870, partial [Novosphingobium sp.]
VHAEGIESYIDGKRVNAMQQRAREELVQELQALGAEEAAVLALLQERLAQAAKDGAGKEKKGRKAKRAA